MTYATTAKFSELVLEVEWVASSGTYAKVCGLTSKGIQRQSNMQTSEVPDCDDEDAPAEVQRSVQSQEVTISGSGVWSQESHGNLTDWWYSGATKNIRVQHVNASSGELEYESGPAYLVNIGNAVDRGQKVTAELAIEFDGLPTRTNKS